MIVYHLTNPIFLYSILEKGLVPKIGDSTLFYHGEKYTSDHFDRVESLRVAVTEK